MPLGGEGMALGGGGMVLSGCDVLCPGGEVRERMDVAIDDGRIVAIEGAGGFRAVDGWRRIDATGLVAVPGLINAHTHSPENCLRGVGERLPLELWLMLMFGVAGTYSPYEHYVCAAAGALEMLRRGTTTVVDHLWMTPPSSEAVDAVMSAYCDAGIRACVAPLMNDIDATAAFARAVGFDLGPADMARQLGFLPAEDLLGQLRDSMERWQRGGCRRVGVLAGPGGVQWCSDALLQGMTDIARDYGSGIHIHLLETRLQAEVCRHRFGHTAVQALDRLGVLSARCSLAHAVWLTDRDVELIAERNAIVVHNPAANGRLGSGRARIADLRENGATIALGTDGAASSDNQSLWDAAKLAALIHNDGSDWVDSHQAFAMATSGGASVIGRTDDLGRLAVGARADIALIERAGPGLAGAADVEAAMVLSDGGCGVRHVLVEGELVVHEGKCITMAEGEIFEELRALVGKRLAAMRTLPRKTTDALDAMRRFLELTNAPAPTSQAGNVHSSTR